MNANGIEKKTLFFYYQNFILLLKKIANSKAFIYFILVSSDHFQDHVVNSFLCKKTQSKNISVFLII